VNGQYGEMYEYSDASDDIGVSTQTSGGGLLDFEMFDDVENSPPNADYIYKQEVTSQNDFKEEVSTYAETKIVGGKYDSLFEEAQKRDPTLPDEENIYTVSDYERDIKSEAEFEATIEAERIEIPVFVERSKPKERTINMQFNDLKIYNLTIEDETETPMDSNATDDVFVDPDKKISPTVDLPTVELKDARYCDGHLVQNNQISWSPATQCPDNMMKKPMGLKIKCKSIHACTLEDCCVAKCTSEVCTDAKAPYAIYEKVCSSLQGETLSDPSKCSARQCCTNKPANCNQYLATNKCSEGRVPQHSEEFFGTGVTDYENQCCPFVSNCKVFDEKYGCPANLELHIFPESIPCYGIKEDTCDIVDCCSPISVPDYEQGWAYYENNRESDDVEEPYYHAEFVGHFIYEADQLVMYNVTPGSEQRARIENCRTACAYQNPNTIQGGEWSTFGQATGFVMVNRYKCICQKIQEHADFVVPPLRQKFTHTNQLDVLDHLIKYNSVMFETYTLAPVRVHDYRFDAVFLNTFGKCSLPIYLDGHSDMAPKLPSSDPLYNVDGKIECMNRCLAEYPEVRGFFILHSDQSCACANNKCENIVSHNSYRAYEIVPAKVEPSCPLFPVPRNDYKKPEHAVYCKNCTDLNAETTCDEWAYITPDSDDSDFDRDESWSCPNFENVNATCTKCKGTTCLEVSCNIGFSNENGIIEDGCETRCNDECQICDTYNASKCVQRFCVSGQRPSEDYITDSFACESCPSGQFGTGTACIQCQAGTYQDEQAQGECKNCAIGRYSQYQGRISPCKNCPPKTMTKQTGSDAEDKCVGCPSGHELRNNVCTMCEAGKVEIDSVCRICARGYTSLPGTSRSCVTCSQGRSIRGIECIDCPVGRFKGAGQTECEACPQGWFQSEERSAECQKCPENTLSFYEASSTCYCIGNTQNCDSPIKLLSKERVLEKVHKLLYSNTGLIQPFLDILGTKCLEDIKRNHENCNECSNPFNSNLKCLQTSSGPVQDTDEDGYMDYVDAFPEDPTEWKDSDGDGVGDNSDAFPNDPTRSLDSDGDGYGDEVDDLPYDPTEWIDSDRDGVGDNSDEFPNDPLEWSDTDGDGVGDNSDEFPNDPTEWTDADNDGLGDNEDDPHPNDSDNDGFTNLIDEFPLDPTEWVDSDNDGVGDQQDDPHPGDTDNDGAPNPIGFDPFDASANEGKTWHDQPGVDHFPTNYTYQTDTDGDGIPDKIDPDKDGDGHANEVDAFPMDKNEWIDTDGDGIGNNADPDKDNDGRLDTTYLLIDSGTCSSNGYTSITTTADCNAAQTALGLVDNQGDGANTVSQNTRASGCIYSNSLMNIMLNTHSNSNACGSGSHSFVCVCKNAAVDVFPLDPTEWSDMDSDGIGDNSDPDKDGDGRVNSLDLLPAICTTMQNTAGPNSGLGRKGCDSARWSSGYWSHSYCTATGTSGTAMSQNLKDYFTSCCDWTSNGCVSKVDAFPEDATESTDIDGDGIGDNTDTDKDGDGYANTADLFPTISYDWSDLDNDGKGDNTDTDKDGDGYANTADAFPNQADRAIDTDGDGHEDWRLVDGEKAIVDQLPNDNSDRFDSDGDGVGDSADTFELDPRRKGTVRAGLTPVQYSYGSACSVNKVCNRVVGNFKDNAGVSLDSAAHPMILDLSAWGGDAVSLIFGAWGGGWFKMVRTNVEGVMQETRYTNQISSIDALTLSYWNAVASRKQTEVAGKTTCVSNRYCLQDFHNPKFDMIPNQHVMVDGPLAGKITSRNSLSYTPQHMSAQVLESSVYSNTDKYTTNFVAHKACNYESVAVVQPIDNLVASKALSGGSADRAQQVENCKNKCTDKTTWPTAVANAVPDHELAYTHGYPTNYNKVNGVAVSGGTQVISIQSTGLTWNEMVQECAKTCYSYTGFDSLGGKSKGFLIHLAHSTAVGRCYCSSKHSSEGSVYANNWYAYYNFKTLGDNNMNSEDKITGFFLHNGRGDAALEGQCVCIKQDPYENVNSGNCIPQYDTYAIKGQECEKTSQPEYEEVWEEHRGYCPTTLTLTSNVAFSDCEKQCFDDPNCDSFGYQHDSTENCMYATTACTKSNLIVNKYDWITYFKRPAANQRWLGPPMCHNPQMVFGTVGWGNRGIGCDSARWSSGGTAYSVCVGTYSAISSAQQDYFKTCCKYSNSKCEEVYARKPEICNRLKNFGGPNGFTTYKGCDSARWSSGAFSQSYCQGYASNMNPSHEDYNSALADDKEFFESCCDWTGSECVDKWDNRFYDPVKDSYHRVRSNSKCRRVFKWTAPNGIGAYCHSNYLTYGNEIAVGQVRVFNGNDNGCSTGDRECHVSRCAAQCFSGNTGPSGKLPDYGNPFVFGDGDFNDIAKGFNVRHSDGRCYCTYHGQSQCSSLADTESESTQTILTLYTGDGTDRYTDSYTGYEFMTECPEEDEAYTKWSQTKLVDKRGQCTDKAVLYETKMDGVCDSNSPGSCEKLAHQCAKSCAQYHWSASNHLASKPDGMTFYSDLYAPSWDKLCPIGEICDHIKGKMVPSGYFSSGLPSSDFSPMRLDKDLYVFGMRDGVYFKMVPVTMPGSLRAMSLGDKARYMSYEPTVTITSASQSNPYRSSSYPASHAYDGNVNSFTHTKYPGGTSDHWLELVLQGGTRHLSKVKVTNRWDCCQKKLKEFRIQWQKNGESSWTTCANVTDFTTKEAKTFDCVVNSDVDIRAVRLYKYYSNQASGDNTLHVAEVEIYQQMTIDKLTLYDWETSTQSGTPCDGNNYCAGNFRITHENVCRCRAESTTCSSGDYLSYHFITDGICSDYGYQDIQTAEECTKAAKFLKGDNVAIQTLSPNMNHRPSKCYWQISTSKVWINPESVNNVEADPDRHRICREGSNEDYISAKTLMTRDDRAKPSDGTKNYESIAPGYYCSNYGLTHDNGENYIETDDDYDTAVGICSEKCRAMGYTAFFIHKTHSVGGIGNACMCASDDCSARAASSCCDTYSVKQTNLHGLSYSQSFDDGETCMQSYTGDFLDRNGNKGLGERFNSLLMYRTHEDYDESNGNCVHLTDGDFKETCEKNQCAKQCYSGEFGPLGMDPGLTDPLIPSLYTQKSFTGYQKKYHYTMSKGSTQTERTYKDFRMYMCNPSSSSDGKGYYPDGTNVCDASFEQRRDECARACYKFMWDQKFRASGFLVHSTGTCYCSIPRAEGTQYFENAEITTHADYRAYDFNRIYGQPVMGYSSQYHSAGTGNDYRIYDGYTSTTTSFPANFDKFNPGSGTKTRSTVYPDGTPIADATPQQRVEECARACFNWKTPSGKLAPAFFVQPSTGRCYCSETARWSDSTSWTSSSSYISHNFIRRTRPNFGRGRMKAFAHNAATGECSCKTENAAQCKSRAEEHKIHDYSDDQRKVRLSYSGSLHADNVYCRKASNAYHLWSPYGYGGGQSSIANCAKACAQMIATDGRSPSYSATESFVHYASWRDGRDNQCYCHAATMTSCQQKGSSEYKAIKITTNLNNGYCEARCDSYGTCGNELVCSDAAGSSDIPGCVGESSAGSSSKFCYKKIAPIIKPNSGFNWYDLHFEKLGSKHLGMKQTSD
jgi:hypothetical protein